MRLIQVLLERVKVVLVAVSFHVMFKECAHFVFVKIVCTCVHLFKSADNRRSLSFKAQNNLLFFLLIGL